MGRAARRRGRSMAALRRSTVRANISSGAHAGEGEPVQHTRQQHCLSRSQKSRVGRHMGIGSVGTAGLVSASATCWPAMIRPLCTMRPASSGGGRARCDDRHSLTQDRVGQLRRPPRTLRANRLRGLVVMVGGGVIRARVAARVDTSQAFDDVLLGHTPPWRDGEPSTHRRIRVPRMPSALVSRPDQLCRSSAGWPARRCSWCSVRQARSRSPPACCADKRERLARVGCSRGPGFVTRAVLSVVAGERPVRLVGIQSDRTSPNRAPEGVLWRHQGSAS